MAYTKLPIQTAPQPSVKNTSFMAPKGINLRDLPQLLDVNFAEVIQNYLITAKGGLEKRKGIEELFDASAAVPGLLLQEWTSDILVYGHGTTVAVYQISTDTSTNIKTNFVESGFSGARYGDYFFVASPGDKIGRLSFTLDYDGQTANFATGLVLTGGTSGATAVILEDNDAGATGTLTLGSISGTFENNEAITDSATGAAVANGTLSFTFTSITNAPKAKIIKAIDTRLFAGNLETDSTSVQYSEVDDGTNPPFTTWNNATGATDGGEIFYRNAGAVNSIENLGKNIIIFCDNGKWAFYIDTIDSAGTLTKVDRTVMYVLDSGAKASIQTDEGIFYVNKEGLWQLVSVGQDNIAYSNQEVLVSNLLGNDYFDDVTLDTATMIKDDRSNTLLINVRDDAVANNKVLTYNTDLKAFGTFVGWNLNDMMKLSDGTIYGIGSNTAKVWTLFSGFDDAGVDIWTEFYQEIKTGALEDRQQLLGEYIQGRLSKSTVLDLKFDIYDRNGTYVVDKLKLQWSVSGGIGTAVGYGSTAWGSDPWGGDVDEAGTVEGGTIEAFDGARQSINEYQRIKLRITGNDAVAHTINWFSIITKTKTPIRRRTLSNIT